jgi:glucose-6-phosphate isomerase
VNIGIGGSDLGIVMAVTALAEQRPKDRSAFRLERGRRRTSTCVDAADPETTLFVICRRRSTLETLTNARGAQWLLEHGGNAAIAGSVAVSTNTEAMDEFGIAPDGGSRCGTGSAVVTPSGPP